PSDAERLRAALVRAEQETLRLLAEVVGDVDLPEKRQLSVQRGDLGNRLRHEILMLDRNDRQLEADQLTHLARPRPRCVDYGGAEGLAVGPADPPLAAPRALESGHSRMPAHPSSPIPRALDQGLRQARRIHVPVIRIPDCTQEPARLDERVQTSD